MLLLPAMYEIQQKYKRGCRLFVIKYGIESTTGIKIDLLHRLLQKIFYFAEVENLATEIKDNQLDNGLEKRYWITITDEKSWTKERIERQSEKTTYIDIEPLSIFLVNELMKIGAEQFRTYFTIKDEPWVREISFFDLQKVFPSLFFCGNIKALQGTGQHTRSNYIEEAATTSSPQIAQKRALESIVTSDEVSRWANGLIRDIHASLEGKIDWSLIESGAILTGDPGTGKTTLAKAIAKDSGLKFIQVSASADWVGSGTLDTCVQNVKATFESAKMHQPCIIFVDELDGLGKRGGSDRNDNWTKWMVNAVLTEVDNIKEHQIILLGATNYLEMVDSAIQRSGRFGKIINVPMPNKQALKDIYQVKMTAFSKGEITIPDAVLEACATHTVGKTGADVEEVVKSLVKTAKLQGKTLGADDFMKEIYGFPEVLPTHTEEDSFINNVATHEVGHALVAYAVGTLDVEFITIIPKDEQAGRTTILPKGADFLLPEIKNRICVYLAGRAAEEIYFGEEGISIGAGGGARSDLYRAKALAQNFYNNFGLGGIDKITVPNDDHVQELLTTEYARAKSIIRQYPELFAKFRSELIRKNYLFKQEIEEILAPIGQEVKPVSNRM